MRNRTFMVALLALVLSVPVAAHAQQPSDTTRDRHEVRRDRRDLHQDRHDTTQASPKTP